MYASVFMAVTDRFVIALVLSVVTTLLLIALVVLAFLAARPAMRQNKAEKIADEEAAAKNAEQSEKKRLEEKAADEQAAAEQLAALERAREIARKVEEAKHSLEQGKAPEKEEKAEQPAPAAESAKEPAEEEPAKEEAPTQPEPESEPEPQETAEEPQVVPEQEAAEEATETPEEAANEPQEASELDAETAAALAEEPKDGQPSEEKEESEKVLPFGARPERAVNPYSLSFKAKLIQSGEETQTYYGEIEDIFASFVDVRKTESWSKVRFKIKRDTLALLSFRGSTLCLALAIDPEGRNLRGKCAKNMSGRRAFAATPLLFKLKSEHALNCAKEFIYELLAAYDSERVYVDVRDYRLPYEDSESLARRGLARPKPTQNG